MTVTTDTKLRDLVERALFARDASHFHLMRGDEWFEEDEAEQDRLDNAAFDAERALHDYLLNEHGIGTALRQRMGDVL